MVVADGNVFRIVDGERRYRALSSLYGEDREVSALVADTLYEAFRQAGAPADIARKLMLIAVLGADPHGHADSIQTLDLDARREIRDMAAELGVDADF